MTDHFTYRDLQKCAAREVALRRNVYARAGMTPARSRELAMMEAIARIFDTWARFYGDRDTLSDAAPHSPDGGEKE